MFLAASSTKRTFWGATPDFESKAWFLIWICPHERDEALHEVFNGIRGVVFEPPNAAACIRLVDSTFQKAWMHQRRQGDGAMREQKLAGCIQEIHKRRTALRIHHKLIQSLYSRLNNLTKFKSVTFEHPFPSMHHSNVKALFPINAASNLRHPSLRCQVPLPWSSAKAKLCASANCLCFSQGDLN